PDGTETVLYSFCSQSGCSDGEIPVAGLIADAAGNLYGTTSFGGGGCAAPGCGTVFKLAPDGTETVLYSFCSQSGCSAGRTPVAGLIADSAGNLYGTAREGGTGGYGMVFQLAGSGFVPPTLTFAGTPGASNCISQSIAALTRKYGGTLSAAGAMGYTRVP